MLGYIPDGGVREEQEGLRGLDWRGVQAVFSGKTAGLALGKIPPYPLPCFSFSSYFHSDVSFSWKL